MHCQLHVCVWLAANIHANDVNFHTGNSYPVDGEELIGFVDPCLCRGSAKRGMADNFAVVQSLDLHLYTSENRGERLLEGVILVCRINFCVGIVLGDIKGRQLLSFFCFRGQYSFFEKCIEQDE